MLLFDQEAYHTSVSIDYHKQFLTKQIAISHAGIIKTIVIIVLLISQGFFPWMILVKMPGVPLMKLLLKMIMMIN